MCHVRDLGDLFSVSLPVCRGASRVFRKYDTLSQCNRGPDRGSYGLRRVACHFERNLEANCFIAFLSPLLPIIPTI